MQSPSKYALPEGKFLNAQELATLKLPFIITDARHFMGKDMQGRPTPKIAFEVHICSKEGVPGADVGLLTFGSTSVREDIATHFASGGEREPIGLCYLKGISVAGGTRKLWIFADYSELGQQELPFGPGMTPGIGP